MNVKASALAIGITFVVMALLSFLIFGSSALALFGIPQIDGGTAAVGFILSLAVLFLNGLVFGALVSWLYNAFAGSEMTVTRREDEEVYAA